MLRIFSTAVLGGQDDVERIERDASIRQVLVTALNEGGQHVDAYRADLLRRTAVSSELAGQRFDSVDAMAFGHLKHPALNRVGGQGVM
jgi:hypothetical protein